MRPDITTKDLLEQMGRKGFKMPPEAIEKIRQAMRTRVVSLETRRKLSIAHKGSQPLWLRWENLSEEARVRRSASNSRAHKGKKLGPMTEASKLKMSLSAKERGSGKWMTGKKHSEETKEKIRQAHLGSKSYLWRGGISKLPGYRAFNQKLRQRRKRGNGGSHSFEDWLLLKAMNAYLCPACGNMEPFIKLTEDHIVPISKGGSDDITNIQPLCMECNVKKKVTIVDYGLRVQKVDEYSDKSLAA